MVRSDLATKDTGESGKLLAKNVLLTPYNVFPDVLDEQDGS